MLQYADGFSCSLNQESGSLVIHFTQKEPLVDPETNEVTEIVNPVTSIIMEKGYVKMLFEILQNIHYNISSSEGK